jgi:hypothetical protein
MSSFTKQIEAHGQHLEFSFARIQSVHGPKYFVMVADTEREYHFVVEKHGEDWMVNDAPKVPEWIHELAPVLVQAIIENETLI